MSRIGRKPIVIPADVQVTINGNHISVKGPKGALDSTIHPLMKIEQKDGQLLVSRPNDGKQARSLHGLSRTIVANMVQGVFEGFKKDLEIHGIGYRAQKQGTQLVMNLGFSHQVIMDEKDGITVDVPEPTKIVVNGIDKQKVGQFAAEIREKRPPEPYKGKGIRYAGEHIIRKEGKSGKTGS